MSPLRCIHETAVFTTPTPSTTSFRCQAVRQQYGWSAQVFSLISVLQVLHASRRLSLPTSYRGLNVRFAAGEVHPEGKDVRTWSNLTAQHQRVWI
jgi:hypothetical protein